MANTDHAKKTIRSTATRRVQNDSRRRAMKEALKAVEKATDNSAELLTRSYKTIDKALKAGVIKANTAARRKAKVASDLKAKSAK